MREQIRMPAPGQARKAQRFLVDRRRGNPVHNSLPGVVHCAVGRKSFDVKRLAENTASLLREILAKKPSTAKGIYLKSITLSSTMGPGVRIDPGTVAVVEEDN